MSKQVIKWLDPILLTGLLISIGVGLVAERISNNSQFSFTVGLLGAVITLLFDVIARVQRTESTVLDVSGLSRLLSLDAYLSNALMEVTSSYERMKKYEYDKYRKLAVQSIDECRAKLLEIASGKVRIPTTAIEQLAFEEFEHASRDVKVTHSTSMDFWKTEFGRKYFGINQAAIKRGVKTTRIFALTDDAARDNLEILKEHERAGVRVLILQPEIVRGDEFTIFDDRILVYYETDEDEKGPFRVQCAALDPLVVKKAISRFEELAKHPYTKTIKEILPVARDVTANASS